MALTPWGSIIGGALGIGASIYGGLKASEAMKRAKEKTTANLDAQRAENQSWYDRRYNEDPTLRADAQRILTRTAESIKQRNKEAAGAAAVAGGTEESAAATKAANAQALGEAASRIAAEGAARKDAIEQQYRGEERRIGDALAKAESDYEVGRANAITQAMQGVSGAAGAAGTAVDDMLQPGKDLLEPQRRLPATENYGHR